MKVTVETLQNGADKHKRKYITQEVADELNNLAKTPRYGEQIIESFMYHMKEWGATKTSSVRMYIDALKFYALTSTGDTQVGAYRKVFYKKLQERVESRGGVPIPDNNIHSEAAQFASSKLVTSIAKRALIPVSILNQGNVQLAINVLVKVATTSKSDIARTNAALGLLKELKPPEPTEIQLDVSASNDESLEALRKATQALINAEHAAISSDTSLTKKILERNVIDVSPEKTDKED